MKKIPLTWGCEALVDDCDFESLNKHSWYWTSSNMKYGYAVTGHKAVGMHNMILPPPTGMEVDHINGNGLDNQRHNLRHVTRAQQCMNRQRGSKKKGTSKYKGVRFWNNNKKWHARIGVNGRKIHLGYFIREEDAARAYNVAAVKYFGEYACLNEICGTETVKPEEKKDELGIVPSPK